MPTYMVSVISYNDFIFKSKSKKEALKTVSIIQKTLEPQIKDLVKQYNIELHQDITTTIEEE